VGDTKCLAITKKVWNTTREQDVVRILAHSVAHIILDEPCGDVAHTAAWKEKCLELGGTLRHPDYFVIPDQHEMFNRAAIKIQDELLKTDLVTDEICGEIMTSIVIQLLAEGHDREELLEAYVAGVVWKSGDELKAAEIFAARDARVRASEDAKG